MAITELGISELNNFLESDCFDIDCFDNCYKSLKLNNTLKIKIIDFEYYNEKRLEESKKEKTICVKLQNFEKAASYRDLELECQKYVDLKTELKIEKSAFYYEQNYLMYFYLGTAKNDKLVREYLKKNQYESL